MATYQNVPNWATAQNGQPGNLDATNTAAQLNQHLGTHNITPVYNGNVTVSGKAGGQGFFWFTPGNADLAQAFTMSGTTIGRVTIPLENTGSSGADLFVTLCPDNGSGAPNTATPIAQAKVPAAVINNLQQPAGIGDPSAGGLASPFFNTQFMSNYAVTEPWTSPAATVNGAPSYYAQATSGNYTIFMGGYDTTASASTNLVAVAGYEGGGIVGSPVPQQVLPQSSFYAQAAATSDTVVYMGGNTGSTILSTVWSAGWDPNTGTVANWSSQVALPQPTNQGAAASWNNIVYLIGGTTTSSSTGAVNNVWYSTVTNGQLSSWVATTPLPVALTYAFAGVVGDWLVVAGGLSSSSTVQSATYYAPIRPNGDLGPWQTGPTMVGPAYTYVPTWHTAVTDSSLIVMGGYATTSTFSPYVQVLMVNDSGVAPAWNAYQAYWQVLVPTSAFDDGNGTWYVIQYRANNIYYANQTLSIPTISVPLNATGLTSGTTYWIVLQQYQTASTSDYLKFGLINSAYTTDAQKSHRRSGTWVTAVVGYSIPLTFYDNTASGTMLHTVEDLDTSVPQAAVYDRWSTTVSDYRGRLLGYCEVTQQPNSALNSNPTFTAGVSPWTAVNGTLTQSSVQTHGGYAYSGLITPNGTSATVFAKSEAIPASAGPGPFAGGVQWYVTTGWFYCPPGWSSLSLSVAWHDAQGNLLSVSGVGQSIPAGTWTQITNYWEAPAGTASAQIEPTLSGTPSSSTLLYMSNVQLFKSPETVGALASVAQVDYPAGAIWPPIGVTQLA